MDDDRTLFTLDGDADEPGAADATALVKVQHETRDDERLVGELERALEREQQRYELLDRLGSGGMGVVYKARDRERDQLVALKTLHRLEPAALLHLKNEFRRVADVSHRNLVSLHELVAVGNHWFLTMEYIPGRNLHEVLAEVCLDPDTREGNDAPESEEGTDLRAGAANPETPKSALKLVAGPPPARGQEPTGTLGVEASWAPETRIEDTEDGSRTLGGFLDDETVARIASQPDHDAPLLDFIELRRIFAELARGIRALHEAGMLHCDIKPANAMVTDDGRVVILDFGLVSPDASGGSEGDRPRRLAGTPSYMAPEQISGAPPTPAADWYAFGTMLYEALAGSRPYMGSATMILSAKLRVDPHPLHASPEAPRELVELAMKLLRRDPRTRPDADEIFAALGIEHDPTSISRHRDTGLLFGRAEHLNELRTALGAAGQGAPVVVHVHGLSGAGKSALTHRFLDEIHQREDTIVLHGRCYERESVPYKAFDSLVDSLADHLADLLPAELDGLSPPHLADLVRLFPVLRKVRAFDMPADMPELGAALATRDQQELRRRAFRGLKQLLAAIAQHDTLVLWIDDLQWGDRDSGQMLADLLAPPGAPWLLLMLSYRSEEAADSAFLREYEATRPEEKVAYHEVEVGPLSPGQARRLAAALSGVSEDDPRVAAIAEQSQGLPFFVEYMARHLAERDSETVVLEQVMRERVAELDPQAQRLLESIAVAGRPLPQGVAANAIADHQLSPSVLNSLRNARFVRTGGPRESDPVEAYHDRIRSSIVAGMAKERRVATHRGLALAYEAAGLDEPEALWRHWSAVGELAKAGGYALEAADRATRSLAFDTAAALYARAGECLPEDRSIPVKRADALANAGRLADAAVLYLEAAGEAPDEIAARKLERRAAEQFLLSGHTERGVEVLHPLLRAARLGYPRSPRWALFGIIARSIRLGIRGVEFERREEHEIPPEELERVDLAWAVGRGLGNVDIMRGTYYLIRAVQLALEVGEPRRISRALAQFGLGTVSRGGPKEVAQGLEYIELSKQIGEELDDPSLVGFARINHGVGEMTLGNIAVAHEHISAGIQLLEEKCTGVTWEISFAHGADAGILRSLGRYRELSITGAEWLRNAVELGDKLGATWVRLSLAPTEIARDNPEGSAEMIAETRAEWSPDRFTPQHLLAEIVATEIERYRGNPRAAVNGLERMWKTAERSFAMGWQTSLVASLEARAMCQLALAAASEGPTRERALALARRDAKRIDKQGRHYASAAAALIRGSLAQLEGRSEEAAAQFLSAIEWYEQVDMRMHIACAQRGRGLVIGGDEGEELLARSGEAIEAEGIVDVERWASIYLPAFVP